MTHHFEHRMRARKFVATGVWTFVGFMAAIVLAFLLGWIIMHLWNWLMPDLFDLGTINYWQALGLFLLAKLLFGSFRMHRGKSRRERFKERWATKRKDLMERDCMKWKHYNDFWKEEGESAYNAYVERNQNEGEKHLP